MHALRLHSASCSTCATALGCGYVRAHQRTSHDFYHPSGRQISQGLILLREEGVCRIVAHRSLQSGAQLAGGRCTGTMS